MVPRDAGPGPVRGGQLEAVRGSAARAGAVYARLGFDVLAGAAFAQLVLARMWSRRARPTWCGYWRRSVSRTRRLARRSARFGRSANHSPTLHRGRPGLRPCPALPGPPWRPRWMAPIDPAVHPLTDRRRMDRLALGLSTIQAVRHRLGSALWCGKTPTRQGSDAAHSLQKFSAARSPVTKARVGSVTCTTGCFANTTAHSPVPVGCVGVSSRSAPC